MQRRYRQGRFLILNQFSNYITIHYADNATTTLAIIIAMQWWRQEKVFVIIAQVYVTVKDHKKTARLFHLHWTWHTTWSRNQHNTVMCIRQLTSSVNCCQSARRKNRTTTWCWLVFMEHWYQLWILTQWRGTHCANTEIRFLPPTTRKLRTTCHRSFADSVFY